MTVLLGHVDAGKSTLMGHLLYKLGHVSKKTMHKQVITDDVMIYLMQCLLTQRYEKESTKVGKASFAFAWVLDETGEERNRYCMLVICDRHIQMYYDISIMVTL